jgi:hypothetical protein
VFTFDRFCTYTLQAQRLIYVPPSITFKEEACCPQGSFNPSKQNKQQTQTTEDKKICPGGATTTPSYHYSYINTATADSGFFQSENEGSLTSTRVINMTYLERFARFSKNAKSYY